MKTVGASESLYQRFSVGFNISIQLEISYDEEVKQWVSCCPVLDLYSQGDTKEQAIENIHEAVSLFLGTCYELGTLNQVLPVGLAPTTGVSGRPSRSRRSDPATGGRMMVMGR